MNSLSSASWHLQRLSFHRIDQPTDYTNRILQIIPCNFHCVEPNQTQPSYCIALDISRHPERKTHLEPPTAQPALKRIYPTISCTNGVERGGWGKTEWTPVAFLDPILKLFHTEAHWILIGQLGASVMDCPTPLAGCSVPRNVYFWMNMPRIILRDMELVLVSTKVLDESYGSQLWPLVSVCGFRPTFYAVKHPIFK